MIDRHGKVNRFSGRVEGGYLTLVSRSAMTDYVRNLPDCTVTVTVEQWHPNRTMPQNAYYFGVIVAIFSEHTGYPKPDAHEILKAKCLPMKIMTVAGDELSLPRSSAQLTTVEFTEFIDNCRRWLVEQFELTTPSPDYAGA